MTPAVPTRGGDCLHSSEGADPPRKGSAGLGGTLTLSEHAPDHETDIRGAFPQTTHEVGEPFTTEWNVDADPESVAFERALQVAADTVQHLEFVCRRINLAIRREGARGVEHRRIVRRDGGVGALRQE